MSNWAKGLGLICLAGLGGCQAPDSTSTPTDTRHYGYGQPVSAMELSSWDIDVGPDGAGLPPGRGTADEGEPVYLEQCAACHGEFGEGMGRYPALVGSRESLTTDRPSKTVGSYWPYATTVWDYVNRAMPFGNAQSLTADQVYGITAYILAMNEIIDSDTEMNAQTLPQVRMPNRDGFITATGTDIHAPVCMTDCVQEVKIVSRASDSALARQGE